MFLVDHDDVNSNSSLSELDAHIGLYVGTYFITFNNPKARSIYFSCFCLYKGQPIHELKLENNLFYRYKVVDNIVILLSVITEFNDTELLTFKSKIELMSYKCKCVLNFKNKDYTYAASSIDNTRHRLFSSNKPDLSTDIQFLVLAPGHDMGFNLKSCKLFGLIPMSHLVSHGYYNSQEYKNLNFEYTHEMINILSPTKPILSDGLLFITFPRFTPQTHEVNDHKGKFCKTCKIGYLQKKCPICETDLKSIPKQLYVYTTIGDTQSYEYIFTRNLYLYTRLTLYMHYIYKTNQQIHHINFTKTFWDDD
jgi:hypothetical protein